MGIRYTSLHNTAMSINKGKAHVGEPVPDLSGPAIQKHVFEGQAEQGTPGINNLLIAWLPAHLPQLQAFCID
jgi:hypothetical protein